MKTMANRLSRWITADWTERLAAVLAFVFLYQYVVWIKDEQLLLPETYRLIDYSLIAVVVIEVLALLSREARLWLQAAAVVAIHVSVLDYTPIGGSWKTLESVWTILVANISQLMPFLWFGLGALALYVLCLWSIQVKWRIYVLTIVSVFLFSVRDSFSKLILWEQVAIMMFCGMAILVLRHFESLRRKNPASWAYFAEYPFAIAGPTLALLVVIVALGALAPEVRPMLTDPYTWWKNSRGESVVTGGKGYIAAAAEGNSSSGYSRNDQALGGNFDFDYTPIMSVDTTYRGYWRGETRTLYTGRGWERSEQEERAATTPVGIGAVLTPDPRANVAKLQTQEVLQTFTMLAEDPSYPVLFGTAGVQKVMLVGEQSSGAVPPLRWASVQRELRWDERARTSYPITYSVVSQMPVLDEVGLREAPPEFPTKARFQEELQVPSSLPERVRALALEVTSTAQNPYDKAKQLETYLTTTFRYTNEPDLSKGRSRDFVDRFLFEIQEGYCDYYSSAFVIMARTLGIPARWVKGYSSGMLPIEEELAGIPIEEIDPNQAGIYTVRNADAHSWAELYFEGYGWMPFEPTAGFVLPTALPVGETLTLPETEFEPAAPEVVEDESRGVWLPLGIGLLCAAALAAWAYFRREKLVPLVYRLLGKSGGAGTPNQRVVLEFERLLRFARRKGFRREEHETAREAAERWSRIDEGLRGDLERLLQLFEKAKYSRAPVTDEEWETTVRIVRNLRESL